MANAQLMEEELQQSVVLSEEDAEFEEDDVVQDTTMINSGIALNPNTVLGSTGHGEMVEDHEEEDQEEDGDVNMMTYQDPRPAQNQSEDLEIDPTNDEDIDHEDEESESEVGDVHEDDEAFDIDAEGEEDEEEERPSFQPKQHVNEGGDLSGEDEEQGEEGLEEEEDDDDEAEGVGAVKIKPGETDDEDSDSESSESSASAFSDRESVAEWDDAVENEEEEEDDNRDEDSDAVDPPICIFCKTVAGHDSTDAGEILLACKGCDEHGMSYPSECFWSRTFLTQYDLAHLHCARDDNAINDQTGMII
jgi:histone acetyltransferase SAS3